MGLSVGKWPGRAVSAYLTETKAGDVQAGIQIAFDDARAAGVPTATWFGGFKSDKAEAKTLETLRLCGWKGDNLEDLSSIDGSVSVNTSCEEDSYNGTTTVKLKWINPAARKLEGFKAREFAERMKTRVRAHDTRDLGPPPAGNEPPPHTDADAPQEEEPF
jgi:hypothetical protein